MKTTCTYKDHRQEIWKISRREVSIVDLRQPIRADDPPLALAVKLYALHPYEVADTTDGIEVLGRFKTDTQALAFAREYVSKQVYLLREKDNGNGSSSDEDKN